MRRSVSAIVVVGFAPSGCPRYTRVGTSARLGCWSGAGPPGSGAWWWRGDCRGGLIACEFAGAAGGRAEAQRGRARGAGACVRGHGSRMTRLLLVAAALAAVITVVDGVCSPGRGHADSGCDLRRRGEDTIYVHAGTNARGCGCEQANHADW
ncbi:MAG: hypothetical protein U9Q37_11280 [Euryarchaeota archaeon]|nr:hypothetical protein [Euryarchaeota archaeon]